MSNKKSQRIISDISEKLKKTIKKYNEMSIDNDLSLQKSNDISEILMKSKTSLKSVLYVLRLSMIYLMTSWLD